MSSTNPEKAASRVAINGVMLASLFVVLAVVFLEPEKFSLIVVAEMVLAIPFLFVSSLAYTKIGYWKEVRFWDSFGYITNTLGNFLLIDSVGLLSYSFSPALAYSYFALIILLMLAYSVINVAYNPKLAYSKALKFAFSTAIVILGGILPLVF
ncbi:MAG TPA: hypothetical protein VJJ47_01285 [Candidatus Paceibacterota bacterium]